MSIIKQDKALLDNRLEELEVRKKITHNKIYFNDE
jgi:hypothetical protein